VLLVQLLFFAGCEKAGKIIAAGAVVTAAAAG